MSLLQLQVFITNVVHVSLCGGARYESSCDNRTRARTRSGHCSSWRTKARKAPPWLDWKVCHILFIWIPMKKKNCSIFMAWKWTKAKHMRFSVSRIKSWQAPGQRVRTGVPAATFSHAAARACLHVCTPAYVFLSAWLCVSAAQWLCLDKSVYADWA